MKKPIIITVIAILLILVVILIVVLNNNDSDTPPESLPTLSSEPISEITSEVTSEEPLTSEITSEEPIVSEPPELISIDSTPADEYVNIEAGAGNLANTLPWVEAERPTRDENLGVINTAFDEVNLTADGDAGFTWEELLQIEPPSLQIGQGFTDELQNFPRRKIQNRDAARVVANEIIEYLDLSDIALMRVRYDSDMNIWIFCYGYPYPVVGMMGMWSSYAVNGYNSQVIRAWIS